MPCRAEIRLPGGPTFERQNFWKGADAPRIVIQDTYYEKTHAQNQILAGHYSILFEGDAVSRHHKETGLLQFMALLRHSAGLWDIGVEAATIPW